jgi:hypothetical protein
MRWKVGRMRSVGQISVYLYIRLINSLARNFRIIYDKGLTIDCSAFRLDKTTTRQGQLETYSEHEGAVPLLHWVVQMMKSACAA